MPSNYPTLKDVSAEAGVSMALASVVLNGKKGRIKASEDTRRKILEAAEKLGYEPDRNARALRMSRSFLIGVLAYDVSTSFVPEILTGIEKGFMHTNYGVLLGSYCTETELTECLEMFRKLKVDGLIIISTEFKKFPDQLAMWNRVAKVFVGSASELPHSSSVCANREDVGILAAQALSAGNHRVYAHVANDRSSNAAGYRRTLIEAGVAPENLITAYAKNYLDQALEAARELLREHPEVTGIFADSDILAAAVVKAAAETGRKIPEELEVIGVDDSMLCQLTTPTLSSIWQPKREQGEIAAELMLKLLKDDHTEQRVLPVKLIVRETLKPSGE